MSKTRFKKKQTKSPISLTDGRITVHDYRNKNRGWGWDIHHLTPNLEDDTATTAVTGNGINKGEFLCIDSSGIVKLWLVTNIEYRSDPNDLWHGDLKVLKLADYPEGVLKFDPDGPRLSPDMVIFK